jgi:hypothetical protein
MMNNLAECPTEEEAVVDREEEAVVLNIGSLVHKFHFCQLVPCQFYGHVGLWFQNLLVIVVISLRTW